MKLSIIIPYYNAKKYTDELLKVLDPQMNREVECILVDDGSDEPYQTEYKWCQVYRKDNGGCSTARNMGLDNAKGDYIVFIDADDLVPEYYIEKLFAAFADKPDIIDFSWKSLSSEGAQHNKKLTKQSDRLKNPSVCTRAFKRTAIGTVRFNELKDSTEDEDFSRKIGYLDPDKKFKRTAITDYMYYYRTAVDNSKIKRFKKGIMKTKRIVYYYKHVTINMRWLLEEIKETDKYNEVWLLTEKNDIPELKRYCQISKPINIWGHELRGEPYSKFTKIIPPIQAQIVFYCEYANMIGGISTFLYNTCQQLKDKYDILVLYDRFDPMQVNRLQSIVRIMKNDTSKEIYCNTLVLLRISDSIPSNIVYKKSIQMCHACKQKIFTVKDQCDYLVNVSQASKESWGNICKDGIVINNMSYPEADELLLVSATRMQAADKGSNDERIRTLAEMLNKAKIPFVWLNFSDKGLKNPPANFINMDPRLNIQGFIKRANYLVQLSDQEAYSMSVLEALTLNTAVLSTPYPSLFEEGFVDGRHGYVIPFDMKFDVTKLLKIPSFDFKYDNQKIIKQWDDLMKLPALNKNRVAVLTPKTPDMVKVKVLKPFTDKHTGFRVGRGVTELSQSRVNEIRRTEKEKKVHLIEVLDE